MLNKLTQFFKRNRNQNPKPDLSEVATDGLIATTPGIVRQYNPDILVRRKGGLVIFDEMRHDDAVKFALILKKQATIAPGFEIEPATDEPKNQEIAEFVEYAFNQMSGSINDVLMQILLALDYGFSISEIVWKMFDYGPHSGKVGIKAIKSKKPHHYDFETDEYSNILKNGLIVSNMITGNQNLPINKFLLYTHQKEFGNWYGISDLRPAYRHWWSKDAIIKFWNIYLERYGQPITRGQYNTNDKTIIDDMKAILKNLQSKTSITHRKGQFDIDFLEPQRRSTADYKEALNFYNRSIARAILIPDRLGEAGETGAYSQAKVHFDIFLWVVKKLRQDIAEIVMEEQLIRRLVNFNYGEVDEYPRFRFNPLTDEQKVELAKAFTDAVQKGSVLPTLDDENHIRRILSFPEKEEGVQAQGPNSKLRQGAGTDQDTDKDKKLMTYIKREPTKYEKQINYVKIENKLNDFELVVIIQIREILKKQRDTLTAFINRKQINGQLTSQLINSLDLKYWGEVKKSINQMYQDTYDEGKRDGLGELPKRFIKAKQGVSIKPWDAINYFKAKSDFIVKGIKEPLILETQRILIDALRSGEAIPITIKKLQDAYIPYIEDGTVIIDKKQLKPYRLEAIIRTSMSEAYNYGRRAIGEDPDVADYVIGYQFSEIIDDRTVEVSKFVDKKIISVKNPALNQLTYPLHWNDRGMFVFVTTEDKPVEFMSEADIARAINMKGI